jgi:hypothetical protein
LKGRYSNLFIASNIFLEGEKFRILKVANMLESSSKMVESRILDERCRKITVEIYCRISDGFEGR